MPKEWMEIRRMLGISSGNVRSNTALDNKYASRFLRHKTKTHLESKILEREIWVVFAQNVEEQIAVSNQK
jgi:hypothetical protein